MPKCSFCGCDLETGAAVCQFCGMRQQPESGQPLRSQPADSPPPPAAPATVPVSSSYSVSGQISGVHRYIGIDFGTSTSVICYKDYSADGPLDSQEPRPIIFEQKYSTVPTLVLVDDAGNTYCGYAARQKAERRPDQLVSNFKMDLVQADSARRQLAQQLLATFFRFLRETYEQQQTALLGTELIEHTLVSYPAKWPDQVRELTVQAAREAGFHDVTGLDEPSAAMQYFLTMDTSATRELTRRGVLATGQPLNVLLIDMGAGTTDFVLYRYLPGSRSGHRVLATWPPVDDSGTFGGREVDSYLLPHVQQYLDQQLAVPFGDNKQAWLQRQCQVWKEQDISFTLNEGGVLDGLPIFLTPYESLLRPDAAPFPRVDRTSFCQLLRDYLPTFPRLVNQLIEQAVREGQIAGPGDIDLVVLTGGHSQWFFVQELLLGRELAGLSEYQPVALPKLQREPFRLVAMPHPQEVVARGLALSGVPVEIQKVGANSLWLQFTIGKTALPPVQALEQSAILPSERRMFGQFPFRYQLYQDIACSCTPLAGSALATATALDPIPIKLKVGTLVKVLEFLFSWAKGVDKDTVDLYFRVNVNEHEHLQVIGLLTATWTDVMYFAVNRGQPDGAETEQLAREYQEVKQALQTSK